MNAIETQGLTRSFGKVQAIQGLDLQVPSGQVFGYLGPNGAGKTTTLHLLLGILRPDAGQGQVLGRPLTQADQIRAQCGVLLEHDGLYERLSAEQNLRYHAQQYGFQRDQARARAMDVLERAGFAERADDPIADFSRGMKRRIAVLRAFVADPKLVFLDEPTSGFDPKVAADLRDFLRTITRESGVTVFLTTHNLQEAESMCDEVAVLRQGRIVAQGRPGGLRDHHPRIRIVGEGFTPDIMGRLRRRKTVADVQTTEEGVMLHLSEDSPAAPIVSSLVRAGVAIEGVERIRSTLEEDFIAIMEGA